MVGSISVDTYLHDCLTPRADIMCLVLETKVLGAPFVLTWLSTRTQIAFSVISSYIYIYIHWLVIYLQVKKTNLNNLQVFPLL